MPPEVRRIVTGHDAEGNAVILSAGAPERIVERLKELESQGLSQIMLYPPLNRQYRVIEDFADRVMARL